MFQKYIQDAFQARDEYEEEVIKLHMAHKRKMDIPPAFQEEIDLVAMNVRLGNEAMFKALKGNLMLNARNGNFVL